jgi:hypothetical protein
MAPGPSAFADVPAHGRQKRTGEMKTHQGAMMGMGIPISQSKRPLPILIPLIWFVQMKRPSRKMAGRRAATHHERCLL